MKFGRSYEFNEEVKYFLESDLMLIIKKIQFQYLFVLKDS